METESNRYRFAREGHDNVLKNFFIPGSIKFREDAHFHVSLNNVFDKVVGKASGLRREDDGWLTAEVEWVEDKEAYPNLLSNGELFLTIFGNELLIKQEGGTLTVESINLRSLFLTSEDPWRSSEEKGDENDD